MALGAGHLDPRVDVFGEFLVPNCRQLRRQIEDDRRADGRTLRTVEGLAEGDSFHPLQQAFMEHHALQCGFCTPGFLMLAVALLEQNPDPGDDEIRDGLSSNLCRRTGYQNILKAVSAAAVAMKAM